VQAMPRTIRNGMSDCGKDPLPSRHAHALFTVLTVALMPCRCASALRLTLHHLLRTTSRLARCPASCPHQRSETSRGRLHHPSQSCDNTRPCAVAAIVRAANTNAAGTHSVSMKARPPCETSWPVLLRRMRTSIVAIDCPTCRYATVPSSVCHAQIDTDHRQKYTA
jgi:hypothetical protein